MAALFSLPFFVGSGRFGSVRFCFSGNTGLVLRIDAFVSGPVIANLNAYVIPLVSIFISYALILINLILNEGKHNSENTKGIDPRPVSAVR